MERSDSISLRSIEASQPQEQATDKNEAKDNSQGVTIAAPASQYPSGIKYYLAVATLCLAIFLVTLDSTIIATATPYISDDFHSLGDVGWYSSVYTMVICTTQLLFGKLLARYSVRWIYSISMLFFLVGSAVCGAAPNSHSLIIGRALAGVGCSGLLVAAFSLVPILVAPAKRPIILGLLSGSRGLATTFGPLIGGVLTEKVSWRWNFYINLPIGAVIQIAFFLLVHPPKRDHEAFTSWTEFLRTLDLFGLVALLPSIVCLLLALQWGGLKYAWQDARIIVLLVLAGILAIAFISVEIWQGPKAMLPSRVFTQRTVSAASFFGFCTVSAIFVLTYYLPIWFQGVKSATPIQSGIWTLPWVITSTIVSLAGGILMSKIIFAVSSSLCSVTPLMVAQQALPLKDIPIGSGLVMFSQTVGASIFVAVAQALFTNELSAGLEGTAVGDGLDVSRLLSGGISTLTEGLSGQGKRAVLVVLNEALTRSWQLAVVLECVAVIGVLAVVHGMRMKRAGSSTSL
ncbi:major facilitator superfamily domain-containing protein [Aspergillus welwitschiae]|uniref:Major facilitator superfamily domain-containing protein n=1 Tax=Aspergillus welwitschiae TaxID=1341132 RepID=A0A3F3QJE9_9EURO|nr:major facilitator superfamily domain-containing protein [Aspergillus welwitschiae]RDH38806.1 major facilitator superfamily domain-containing protein [Aspergillus welwitschiae]